MKKNTQHVIFFDISSLIDMNRLNMTKQLEQEFEKMMDKNTILIYKVCRFYCTTPDDIADLFQEISIRLWKGFQRFQPNAKISTWVYRVALNTAIDFYKKKQSFPVTEEINDLTDWATTMMEADREWEMTQQLFEMIEKLGGEERAIILLYLDGKTHQEIASIANCSVTNVGTKIQRIKEKLKKMR